MYGSEMSILDCDLPLQHCLHLHVEALHLVDFVEFGEELRVEGDNECRREEDSLR
jgi:hypothetical protein